MKTRRAGRSFFQICGQFRERKKGRKKEIKGKKKKKRRKKERGRKSWRKRQRDYAAECTASAIARIWAAATTAIGTAACVSPCRWERKISRIEFERESLRASIRARVTFARIEIFPNRARACGLSVRKEISETSNERFAIEPSSSDNPISIVCLMVRQQSSFLVDESFSLYEEFTSDRIQEDPE